MLFFYLDSIQGRFIYTGPASQLCTTVAPAAQPKTARTRGSQKKRGKHRTTQTQKGGRQPMVPNLFFYSIPFQLVAHLLNHRTQSKLKPLKFENHPQPSNCKIFIQPCYKKCKKIRTRVPLTDPTEPQ